LLVVLVVLYLVAVAGRTLKIGNLYDWLALNPSAFWKGRVWQVFTYALLPAGFLDLIFNVIAIIWLGGQLEREWSRWELWSYCLLAATGTGMAKLSLSSRSGFPMVGASGVAFGLLVAWLRLFGNRRISLWSVWETTVLRAGLLLMALYVLLTVSSVGVVNAVIMFGGGLTGWLYLSLRWTWNRAQPSRLAKSERIRRLEL
jgi:membrane associated rhomboid family serine protease